MNCFEVKFYQLPERWWSQSFSVLVTIDLLNLDLISWIQYSKCKLIFNLVLIIFQLSFFYSFRFSCWCFTRRVHDNFWTMTDIVSNISNIIGYLSEFRDKNNLKSSHQLFYRPNLNMWKRYDLSNEEFLSRAPDCSKHEIEWSIGNYVNFINSTGMNIQKCMQPSITVNLDQ